MLTQVLAIVALVAGVCCGTSTAAATGYGLADTPRRPIYSCLYRSLFYNFILNEKKTPLALQYLGY